MLTTASLMVAGPAAADAVRRARTMPNLRVGLHLVVIEGPAILPPAAIPNLLNPSNQFGADQIRRGFSYFFRPTVRRQLAAEINAQFAAFAATGLALDHANAHKHMHLHPTIGRLLIEIGRNYGLPALRVPAEPPAVLAACGEHPGPAAHAMQAWSRILRAQASRAGLRTNNHAFGIAWSGHMTANRVHRLLAALPGGLSEIYFHPATSRDTTLTHLMPTYEHEAELAALLDPTLPAAIIAAGATPTSFTDLLRIFTNPRGE